MYQLYLIDFTKRPECISADIYETLQEAIDDFSRFGGWEEMEGVASQSVIIKNDKEVIEAVGVYVNCDLSTLPSLMWIYKDGQVEQRYYETEYSRFINSECEQEVLND
ncbi:Uncharacterized protein dnl_47350 [Desulfonema limicola]|uniref:Uncharacterized protein n=1 Tax=Desulfonema limicola TaxID=45656 RepID=A0A975BBT4_9BACT|nr:hypothetical protein [Desulfonema limicola]QTA82360.1 Uncharacterized protein dnl_47350 [Desulfonema limicola]